MSIVWSGWDLGALRESWRAAQPFPHVVIDELVDAPSLLALGQACAEEPHWPNRGEIYDFMGSGDQVQHAGLRAFQAQLASTAALDAVRAITGRPVTRVELRSYVYMPGSYLLPHTDCRTGVGRLVAFAYYVWAKGCDGGELELFDHVAERGEIVSTQPVVQIAPRENRLVLFDVTPTSLHQVCEVLSGARVSLSGWFYA